MDSNDMFPPANVISFVLVPTMSQSDEANADFGLVSEFARP
jgi:hypothetical protein